MKGESQKRQQNQSTGTSEAEADADLLGQQGDQAELYIAATGARINFSSAKQRLYYFCDKLPSDQ